MSEPKNAAKRTADASAQAMEKSADQLNALMGLNSGFMEAFSEASRSYIEGVTALNEEILNFANERLAEATRTRDVLMQCRDVSEIIRVQQDWVRNASEHYIGEASRLVGLSTKAVMSAVNPIVERAKTAPKDIANQVTAA